MAICSICGKETDEKNIVNVSVRPKVKGENQRCCDDCNRSICAPIMRHFGFSVDPHIRNMFYKMTAEQLKGMISYLPKD